jgi:molecular chaperone GrpE
MADPKDEREESKPQGEVAAEAPQSGTVEEELRRKTDEAAANLDRYLRAVADGENLKKRLQRDKAEAVRFANEGFARDLLQVIDSLELALEHTGLGGDGASVVEGIQLTLRLFRDVLERHRITEVADPTGAPFDPSTQEAAAVEVTAEASPNTVIRCQSKGYFYHDRLLRPARVVVAAGPLSEEEQAAEERAEASEKKRED